MRISESLCQKKPSILELVEISLKISILIDNFLLSVLLISYLQHRMAKIHELRWEAGTQVLPESVRNDTLSSKEKDYFTSYNDILDDYFAAVRHDLSSSLEVCIAYLI